MLFLFNSFAIIFFVFAEPAVAGVKELLEAKSAIEYQEAIKRLSQQRAYTSACRWELASEDIPAHCYLATAESKGSDERRLDRLCERAATKEDSIVTLTSKSTAKGLSDGCRSYIKKQISVLEYQGEI